MHRNKTVKQLALIYKAALDFYKKVFILLSAIVEIKHTCRNHQLNAQHIGVVEKHTFPAIVNQ